jgi:hypothetical protein
VYTTWDVHSKVLYGFQPEWVSGNRLDRKEATALLKELMAKDLIDPSWVSISERSPNQFQLQFKNVNDAQKLEAFTRSHNLVIEVNKNRGYILIYKSKEENSNSPK